MKRYGIALADYFGHRLNLAPGEVSLQAVLNTFPGISVDLEVLFNTVEQRRYGIQADRQNSNDEMKTLLNKLTSTLKACERIRV